MRNFLLSIITLSLLFSCAEIVNEDLNDNSSKDLNCHLFKNQLNEIVTDYISNRKKKNNQKVNSQLVTLVTYTQERDTFFVISSSKYLGEFLDSTIDWRLMGKIDSINIIIGDKKDNYLLRDFYNMNYLNEFEKSSLFYTDDNYTNYYFDGRMKKYVLKGSTFTYLKEDT